MRLISVPVGLIFALSFLIINLHTTYANDRYQPEVDPDEAGQIFAPVLEPQYSSGYDINFDNASFGIVSVFFNLSSDKKKKLVVEKDDQKYIYNVFDDESYVNYPLQMGDGYYKVSLYINTTGTKYKKLQTKQYNVRVKEDNLVYLQSILEIHWTVEDQSIRLAEILVEKALDEKRRKLKDEQVVLTLDEINQVLYQFVIDTIDYDYDKIKGLDYSYTPDNDETVRTETGICYDYSSLYGAMLRSQGIPAKMAKGYAHNSDVYHAWNEVYILEEERWVVVDTTSDAYRNTRGYAFDYEKEAEDYEKLKEF